MHERVFIEAILRDIDDIDRVKKIVLEVGELAGIGAGHLKEHLETQLDTKDQTGLAGSPKTEIEVIKKGSNVKCSCGFLGAARVIERLHDLVLFECPECGGNVDVLEGEEIRIVKVVYD